MVKKSEEELQITSADEWKKDSKYSTGPMKMPSGKTALVRMPGMGVFLKAGMVPNSLQPIITDAIAKGKKPELGKLEEQAETNPELILDIFKLVNDVTVYCVVKPEVLTNLFTDQDVREGRCEEENVGQEIPPKFRDPEALYVDEVDDEDKMFIFQAVIGGTRDVERFREELESDVEPVRPVKKRPSPTKRTGGNAAPGPKKRK